MKRTAKALLFFVLLLVAWQAVCLARVWSPVLVPSPVSVGRYLWEAAGDGTLWGATVVTLKRLLLGYFFGNIPFVQANFELVIVAIVLISLVPAVVEAVKARREMKKQNAQAVD